MPPRLRLIHLPHLSFMRFRFFLALALAAAPCWAKQQITIDDQLAYHVDTGPEPIWSPDGRSFAYERDGVVFRYDVRHRKARKLIQVSELERVAKPEATQKEFPWTNRRVFVDSIQWFPNGADLLVFARSDLFVVHPDGEFEQITVSAPPVEAPSLSPDGTSVLYRANHDLYILDVHTRQSRQLTSDGSATLLNGEADWVYPEELDLHKAAWWSPDSKRIAYLQFNIAGEFEYPQTDLLGRRAIYEPERYPQAGTPNAKVRLGFVNASGGETVWAQAGNSADVLMARVAWFPDSSAVALQTMPRLQNELDLLACDPATGNVRKLVHEGDKNWVNIGDDPVFLHSRSEFLWTSERSGFRHIYRYSNGGHLIAQLTSGDWEVKEISAVDERSHRVFFTGSADSPVETQLYRVDLEGGDPVRMTTAGFDHDVHVDPHGELFVDSFSNVAAPPRCVLRNRSGDQLSVLASNDDPAKQFQFTPPRIMNFQKDGSLFYAKLYEPVGFDASKKWPAIVHVYGGPGAQAIRNSWTGLAWQQVLAANGFVVWEVDNRGSTGRGHRWETPIFHKLGEEEVADQRKGVEQLISLGYVDPKRIGITGWSYGGYMTIHSMLLAPDLFKVGVAGAPVTDWHNYDTIYTERYMGLPSQNETGYEDSSNVENANLLTGTLLIVHNFQDDNVLFQNTMQFVHALDEEDKPYTLSLYGQKTHGVTGKAERQLYQTMTSFFVSNLK